jgi:replicative DNA helicase
VAERSTRIANVSGASAPPHDQEAEAAVLSAIMLSSDLLDEVRDLVEPLDFYFAPHRVLYEGLLALDTAGTKIDAVTVAAHLRAGPGFKAMGGMAFLAQIVDATPSVAHVIEHARIIRQYGVLRRMTGTLRELVAVAQAPETRGDVDGFLHRCEAEVFSANVATVDRETGSTVREMMDTAMVELDPSRPREPRGLSTGLLALDEVTLGMAPGELWYVAAHTSMGKSALVLGIATAVAAMARHVVFFSMEMKRPELSHRVISSDSGVPSKALQQQQLSQDHWSKVITSINTLSRLPIIFDDTDALTPSRLRSRLRRHASTLRKAFAGKLALVVVDYVQLMRWDAPCRTKNEELEHISRALKILAGEFGVTVLACAQLNRSAKDRTDKRPSLSELRGSGALEQDADKVLFVHREEADDRGEAELILGKGRNSGTGKVTVAWQPWCVRFAEARQPGFAWQPADDE